MMDRSLSRSRSQSMEVDTAVRPAGKGNKRERKPRGEELMEISAKEAALIVGKGGQTKKKVEQAADVRLELDTSPNNPEAVTVRVMTKDETKKARARDYVTLLLENKSENKADNQYLRFDRSTPRDDLTILSVPQQTVGYITGKNRSTLHALEEDTKTLMFFESKDSTRAQENLLIFSVHPRGRKQAELKIMSAIESKMPGHFLSGDYRTRFENNDPSLGVVVEPMEETQFTYALGRGGNTRRKIERASGAIMEYVGFNAFIAGTPQERQRGLDYLRMLLLQKDGKEVGELLKEDRSDLTIVEVPRDLVAAVSGARGVGLRRVEEKTDTFCFFETKKEGADRAYQKLFVLGESRRERELAEDMFLREVRRHEDSRRRKDRADRRDSRDRRDRQGDRRRDQDRGSRRDTGRRRSPARRRRSRSRSDSVDSRRSYSAYSDDRSSISSRGPSRRRNRTRSPRRPYRR